MWRTSSLAALFTITCSLLLSCAPSLPPAPRDHNVSRPVRPVIDVASLEKKIHILINEERRRQGLEALERDDRLSRIARAHSRDMALRGYFSHVSPEGNDFSARYRKARYSCSVRVGSTIYEGGENIALNHLYASRTTVNGIVSYDWNSEEEIARTTVRGWMNSTGHRKNILTPHFLHEGIGVHIGADDGIYITQNFC